MAKYFSDLFLIGNSLSGLTAAALLAKHNWKVTWLHTPSTRPSMYDYLWPSYNDPITTYVLDNLGLNLDFINNMNFNSPFAFIEERKHCLLIQDNKDNPFIDLMAYLNNDKTFQTLINDFRITPLNNTLEILQRPITSIGIIDVINLFILRAKHKLSAIKKPNFNSFLKDEDIVTLLSLKNSNYYLNSIGQINSILAYRHGFNTPKKVEYTAKEIMNNLFIKSIKKNNANCIPNDDIIKTTNNNKKYHELTMANNDVFRAREIIDATNEGFFRTDIKRPHENEIEAYCIVDKRAISQVFPLIGMFTVCKNTTKIFIRYAIHSLKDNNEKYHILFNAFDKDNLITKTHLHKEIKRIAKRHFSLNKQEEINVIECNNLFDNDEPSQTIFNKEQRVFRASPYIAYFLGIPGQLALGVSLYKSLIKRIRS